MQQTVTNLTLGLIAFMSINTLEAATVRNVDIAPADQCHIIITKEDGNKGNFDLPQMGTTSEIDLSNHRVVSIQCQTYRGDGKVTNRCIAPRGTPINTLTIQHVPDTYGDYPGCTANR